jgi:hypothetical protein
MSLFLCLGRLYLPSSVRRRRLKQLCALTADAFGSSAPLLVGVSLNEILERYARFTRGESEKAIRQPEVLEKVRERLYSNAFALGSELRNKYRIRTLRDAFQMGRIIYKVLKIDFRWDGAGRVVIRRCFFSSHYTPEVCALISALDEGMMAGLSSGMKLQFVQRITDGSECCTAYFGNGEGAP